MFKLRSDELLDSTNRRDQSDAIESANEDVVKAYDTDHFALPLPAGHRFPMQKYRLLRERIVDRGLPVELALAPAATDIQLHRAHCETYVARVTAGELDEVEIRRIGFPWSAAMVERSRRSSGATLAAAHAALTDGVACNLAGGTHHAGRSRGQGYCVFNDAAVAILDLLASGLIRSAAVIDTDVHQGNGTNAIFADNPAVRTLSIHGEKDFPAKKCAGDVEIALPRGTTDESYLAELEQGLADLGAFGRPDFVVFTSGADPFVDDALGSLALSKPGLASRDRMVFEWCQKQSIPVALTMAGGYSTDVDDIVDIHFESVRIATEFSQRR